LLDTKIPESRLLFTFQTKRLGARDVPVKNTTFFGVYPKFRLESGGALPLASRKAAANCRAVL